MTGGSRTGLAPVQRGLTCLSHSLVVLAGTRWLVAHGGKTALGHPSASGWAVRKRAGEREDGFVPTFPSADPAGPPLTPASAGRHRRRSGPTKR